MFKALKKKNSEYSATEKWVTCVITTMLFSAVGFWLFKSSSISPYIGGLLVGSILGFIGYKYPKVIHISIFALPLMCVGS